MYEEKDVGVSLKTNNVCSCCLAEDSCKDLKTQYIWMGQEEVYENMICFTFGITIKQITAPPLICEKCIRTLRDASNFKTQVLRSQKILKENSNILEIKIEEIKSEDENKQTHQNEESTIIASNNKNSNTKISANKIKSETTAVFLISHNEQTHHGERFTGNTTECNYMDNTKSIANKKNTAAVSQILQNEPAHQDGSSPTSTSQYNKTSNTKSFPNKIKTVSTTVSQISQSEKTHQEGRSTRNRSKCNYNNTNAKTIANEIKTAISVSQSKLKKKQSHQSEGSITKAMKSNRKEDMTKDDAPKIKKVKSTKKMTRSELANIIEMKENTLKLLENTSMVPFRWQRTKYRCFCCMECYENFVDVKNHMQSHTFDEIKKVVTGTRPTIYHKVEVSSLTCKLCSTTTIQRYEEMKTHLISQHNLSLHNGDLLIPFCLENKVYCAICNEEFSVFHNLNVHMNEHYRNYICELCGQGYISVMSLNDHIERHNKEYKCQKCGLKFTSEHQRESHSMANHKAVEKRLCPHCPQRFKSHYVRLLHMIEEHGHQKPEYSCPFCKKVFVRQFLVNAHVREQHTEGKHKCEVCDRKFCKLSQLKLHQAVHSSERKKISCSQCNRSYLRKKTLMEHMKTHKIT